VNDVLSREYALRRAVLLKRIDVTLMSMMRAPRLKDNPELQAKVQVPYSTPDTA
jgi:hypothetical protein